MRIVQVIHGYPMRYNAGSEVYTQALSQALAARHEVHVFTRKEDPFALDYALTHERDPDDERVRLSIVNMPRSRDRYRHAGVDQRFAELVEAVQPDVVHIGHLNHLSTSLVREAARRSIPVVYTLHDYWLMCPRGQFMQMHPEDPRELWSACDGQEDRKCAERCYARYFSGADEERERDVAHWSDWVHRRMAHVREMVELCDLFIAPSRYLHDRYLTEFGIPANKLVYLDYGFDLARLAGRRRAPSPSLAFGYIGTHIPAKGIHVLLQAFGQLRGDPVLKIFGRPRGEDTASLRALAASLPQGAGERVEWLPEYRNQEIVRDVFDRVDAIVVPSIWVENSPLVIHEALEARVAVITADVGGMAEYVRHEENGLLFRHRDPTDLAAQMQRLVDEPALAVSLGQRGYLGSDDARVPGMEGHARAVEELYQRVLRGRGTASVSSLPGPWRITFDTNPDDCNMKCIMCEEHSVLSTRQAERKESGAPRRRMPIALLRQVLADACKMGLREVIPSTMGEPLLYEHFDEIIDLCALHGVKLNLTTNGTFPRKGAKAWAERIVPVTSDVKVSWNGATKRTHELIMVGSSWEGVLRNVEEFIAVRDQHAAAGRNRCRVTFQLTFLETNTGELADIVRLAASLGVDRVKGHHLWAHFDPIRPLSMRRSLEARGRWNEAVREARRAAEIYRLPHGAKVLLENIHPLDEQSGDDLAPGAPCPFLGQEAWVSAEGRFNPCCAPDELRKTLGDFGTLHEARLGEVWSGARYQEILATYPTRALCVGCNMRQPRPLVRQDAELPSEET